jgi:hypothetical protein
MDEYHRAVRVGDEEIWYAAERYYPRTQRATLASARATRASSH